MILPSCVDQKRETTKPAAANITTATILSGIPLHQLAKAPLKKHALAAGCFGGGKGVGDGVGHEGTRLLHRGAERLACKQLTEKGGGEDVARAGIPCRKTGAVAYEGLRAVKIHGTNLVLGDNARDDDTPGTQRQQLIPKVG